MAETVIYLRECRQPELISVDRIWVDMAGSLPTWSSYRGHLQFIVSAYQQGIEKADIIRHKALQRCGFLGVSWVV
eukprot:scaffold50176_cov19-Prasinocladus_malaysianus.AAC.1